MSASSPRKLFSSCRAPAQATAAEERELGIPTGTQIFQEGSGCDACKGTGYRGRTGIHELLVIDDDVRALIMQRSDAAAVRRLATKSGMKTLREDVAAKIIAGVTTVAEVLRVTQEDVA